MPNIASVLKSEISRIARKEIKDQTAVLKRSSAQYRRDIAGLKRQVAELEKKVGLLEKKAWSKVGSNAPAASTQNIRFSAKGLYSHRQRLGISVADYAVLLGVSVPTLYNWENGKSRPRDKQLPRIAEVRNMSKKEAVARIEQLS